MSPVFIARYSSCEVSSKVYLTEQKRATSMPQSTGPDFVTLYCKQDYIRGKQNEDNGAEGVCKMMISIGHTFLACA